MPTDDETWGTPASLPSHTGSRRISWDGLPRSVSSGIEDVLGGEVTAARSQQGGFSDGLAARLEMSDGRRAFAKAVGAMAAPAVGAFHRREIAVTGGLPSDVPAPRLLGPFDDGEWVALILEDVDGALPRQPWRRDELERVLDAIVDWPHAWTGPAHADLVTLLSSVALSGIDPEPFAARHPLLAGVEPEAVDVLISAQAGFLLAAVCSMDSAADPRLERMMTQLSLASLRWPTARRRMRRLP